MKNIASRSIPKSRLPRVVSSFWFMQMEKEGIEVRVLNTDSSRKGAHTVNPLEKLAEAKKLSSEELRAGKDYQTHYNNSNKNHFSRPILDGTPISSANNKPIKELLTQKELDAGLYVAKAKNLIMLASMPHQISGFKEFKDHKRNYKKFSRDKKYLDILKYIFEKGVSPTAAEEKYKIGLSHNTIEERVKEICVILQTIK